MSAQEIVDIADPWAASRAWLDAHRSGASVDADVDALMCDRLAAI